MTNTFNLFWKWIVENQALTGLIFGIVTIIALILAIVWRYKDEKKKEEENKKRKKEEEEDKIFKYYDKKFLPVPLIEELLDKALIEIEEISLTDYNQIVLDCTKKHDDHLYVVADAIPIHKQRYDIVDYDGLIGKSYKTENMIVANDIAKINDYFYAVSETKSEICVPIKFDNHILGVINSESESVNHFSENLQNSLEGIAKALAKNLLRLGWKMKPVYNDLVRIKRTPSRKYDKTQKHST